ncbi:hypothetical protein ACLKMH_09580 [Psychromonas sp. KJ10-10]|uniref:hypothetical protein n=1 Tax=Psychromonas sp. KJ10-10 TaxID=3391823 RepID=UPI0039B6B3A4
MSFRIKTIIGIALIQSVLLIILIVNVMNFLISSNDQQLQQRAETTSTLFAKSVKDSILSTDIATLESFVDEILKAPDIVYVRISSPQHIFVEGGDPQILKTPHKPDTGLAVIEDNIFDTRVEIKEAGVLYGVIEMGISTQSIESLLSSAKLDAFWIATFEILLVVIFSIFLVTI